MTDRRLVVGADGLLGGALRHFWRQHGLDVVGTLRLAHLLAEHGCFVVVISSNLVIDGIKPFRLPDEPTCPRTEYGRQKAEVEAALANLGDRAALIRLTKVFHARMPLTLGWVQSLREGKPIRLFAALDATRSQRELGFEIPDPAMVIEQTLAR